MHVHSFVTAEVSNFKHPRKGTKARKATPNLEELEARTLLNNRFVIPLDARANMTSTFYTLSSALSGTGLQAGDTIQIEPRSTPGLLTSLPALQNLTIKGDPLAGVADIPAIGISNILTIDANRSGIKFANLQMNLTFGNFTFHANGAIDGCNIINYAVGSAVTITGNTSVSLINSRFENYAGGALPMCWVTASAGSANVITGNTFVNLSSVAGFMLGYDVQGAITDQVTYNTFLDEAGNNRNLLDVDNTTGQPGVQGLVIQTNSFSSGQQGDVGVNVHGNGVSVTVKANDFGLNASGAIGLLLSAQAISTSIQAAVTNNIFRSPKGISVILPGAGKVAGLKVEGNDFRDRDAGVVINTGGGGSALSIDLGGGNQGSMGGNNFRGYKATASNSTSTAAIRDLAVVAQGQVSAQKNLFLVTDPKTVIWDGNDAPNLSSVQTTNSLTGNAAYVQALYVHFLKRIGNVQDPNDAGGWVTQLNNGAAASTVANAIIRSTESYGSLVDYLFAHYLGRSADAGGKSAFINNFQHGTTLETTIGQIVTSPEYTNQYASNVVFAQSLYTKVLNRWLTSAELQGTIAQIGSTGRAIVAGNFTGSPEYRTQVVSHFYDDLLRRSMLNIDDVNYWVNSGNDLLTIEVQFASTTDFQTNG